MANDFIIDQVLAQILMFPETHNQDGWETQESCGTTRCVAGWAVHFSEDYDIVNLARFGGNAYPVRKGAPEYDYSFWSSAGADVLGLSEYEAEYLFFECDNEQAVEFLKDLKNKA